MKKGESEALNERNEYILDEFMELKKSCRYPSMYAICKVLSVMPADHHYISVAIASRIWCYWRRTGHLRFNCHFYKKKLYQSFINECEKLQDSGLSNRKIIQTALDLPAPCLGISPHHIFRILKKMKQK